MSNNETKPQVIEYRKLYKSEKPEGDGRASTTFDFRLYSSLFIPGSKRVKGSQNYLIIISRNEFLKIP